MIFKNMEALQIDSVSKVIKAGDTVADILEGKNAGVFTIGILDGSSVIGLSEAEFEALSEDEKNALRKHAEQKISGCRSRCGCPRYPRDPGISVITKEQSPASVYKRKCALYADAKILFAKGMSVPVPSSHFAALPESGFPDHAISQTSLVTASRSSCTTNPSNSVSS